MNVTRAYRGLLRAVQGIDPSKFGHARSNLIEHVMWRVNTERLLAYETDFDEGQMEDYLVTASNKMENLTLVLSTLSEKQSHDAPALFSFLASVAQAVGNVDFHRKLEDGFLDMAEFHDAFKERLELERERGAELKNRALQTAGSEYSEVLAIMANPNFQRETLTSLKPSCEISFYEIPETVAIEVDHHRKRNCIYIHSPYDIRENAYDEHVTISNWNVEPDSVWFTEEYHLAAQNILAEIEKGKWIENNYPTVVTGHSIGAALAVIIASYLKAQHQIDIRNVITFGQPMITTSVMCPSLSVLPIMRMYTPLDGFVETPASAVDGAPFQHYGERLSIIPSSMAEHATPEFIEENKVYVTMEEYHTLMTDTEALLEYLLPRHTIPMTKGYGSILRQDDNPIKRDTKRQKGINYTGEPKTQTAPDL